MKRLFTRIATLFAGVAMFSFALPVFAKPSIGTVSPVNATAGVAITLSASVNSAQPLESCNLYVDLADVGEMDISGNTASKSFTFPFGGSRIAFVFCRDTSGGINAGPNTSIWVEGATENQAPLDTGSQEPEPEPELISEPPASNLVTLECPEGADVNHPCKAVYYIDQENKRHAFPNSRIFFSWYADFDGVAEVSPEALSTYALGRNVRYRPGERMVKFRTDPKVYAVGASGELRWITTEAAAIALYGTDWNTKIDDISDAFYTDYTFGDDIASVDAFSPTAEMNAVADIDANIR